MSLKVLLHALEGVTAKGEKAIVVNFRGELNIDMGGQGYSNFPSSLEHINLVVLLTEKAALLLQICLLS